MAGSVNSEWDDCWFHVGTAPFNAYPTPEEWRKEFEGYCGMGSPASDRYYMRLPVSAWGNAYAGGAKPMDRETDAVLLEGGYTLDLREESDGWHLTLQLPADLPAGGIPVDTGALGEAFEPEQPWENADGTPIVFDTDYFGRRRATAVPGPFAAGWDGVLFDDRAVD